MLARLETLVKEMIQKGITLEEGTREFERRFIDYAMREANGCKSDAARILGIHRNTLASRLKNHEPRPARRRTRAGNRKRRTKSARR